MRTIAMDLGLVDSLPLRSDAMEHPRRRVDAAPEPAPAQRPQNQARLLAIGKSRRI